jgi:nitrite reductase/ring-hydroxylating ferredoxin subunit
MAGAARVICASAELVDGGKGVRFSVTGAAGERPAFAIRFRGRVYAYVNRCAHVPIELDWQEGEFFDQSRLYLICSTHGATYEPDTGRCVLGPCRGANLAALPVTERGGQVILLDDPLKESASHV